MSGTPKPVLSGTPKPVLLHPKGRVAPAPHSPETLRNPHRAREKRWEPDQGQEGAHLFDKVSGVGGEVGGQHQLPFGDLVHGFLPVLCSEGWLEEAEDERSLVGLPPGWPLPGGPPPAPTPALPGRLDLPIQ